jgi:photosystem II stability/assembly factor-like uncharacterized protein
MRHTLPLILFFLGIGVPLLHSQSADAGNCWTRQIMYPYNNHILDIHFAPDGQGWAVGSRGSIQHWQDGHWTLENSNAGLVSLTGIWAWQDGVA